MRVSNGVIAAHCANGAKGVSTVAFSVSKSRPFRSLGLARYSGKHAAPKGHVPEARPAAKSAASAHRPAHAATMPRLTGPESATGPESGTGQQAA
jgi:hypothetical protein